MYLAYFRSHLEKLVLDLIYKKISNYIPVNKFIFNLYLSYFISIVLPIILYSFRTYHNS